MNGIALNAFQVVYVSGRLVHVTNFVSAERQKAANFRLYLKNKHRKAAISMHLSAIMRTVKAMQATALRGSAYVKVEDVEDVF